MSTSNTEKLCPHCNHSYTPGTVFCGNCGYRITATDDKPTIQQGQTTSRINGLSQKQASFILYFIATVAICALVGIVLNGIGMLPSSVASIGSSIGGAIVVISALWGALVQKKVFPKEIWTNANQSVAILAGLLTVVLLTAALLFGPFNHNTSTIQAQNNPHIQAGTLILNDPLSNNGEGYHWEQDTDGPGTCNFIAGAYHVIQLQKDNFTSCTAFNTNFSNFRYEVQMMITKGNNGGIIFRSDGINGNFYYFRIGQDGTFALNISRNNNFLKTIQSGYSSAIKIGLHQSNIISVLANANTFDLYVNNQLIATTSDSTYSEGKIGVIAGNKDSPTEVVFSNANVWTI